MGQGYLFFCKSCGLPQHEITSYVIKEYFKKYGVKGFYCSNCNEYNGITDQEKQKLLNELNSG